MNPVRRIEQSALVVSMFIGSVALWAGAPAFWLWLAGRSSKVSSSSMTSIVMVLVGVPVTMVFIGKGLSRLDARYSDQFGVPTTGTRSVARWLHSMRGGGSTDADQPSMLDKMVVLSVGLALLALGIFYVFFSHGSAARNN
jgi:hypothetical protein